MELELEPSHGSTSTSVVHLHGYLVTAASYPTATMLLSLKMTFSIRWRSSAPDSDPENDLRVYREFTPSLSDTMLHGDRVWEQAVEGMLVSAIAPSRYNPSTEDMGVFVRSICAYGDSALLHWFRSPTYRFFALKILIIFYDDPPPVADVDIASTPSLYDLDGFDFLLNTIYDCELVRHGRRDYRGYGVHRRGCGSGLETSIYGGGDHVEQTGTTTSCAICLGEYEAGEEIVTMPCGHLFHGPCLREWLQLCNTCPFCRFPSPPQRNPNGILLLLSCYLNRRRSLW